MAAFGFVLVGSTLACGGIMSQAAGETLNEARLKVAGCTGDGQPAMLATVDAAIAVSASDVFSFGELVAFQVELDAASADGEISLSEAIAFGESYEAAATN
jgi:hypothetical protein